MFCTICFDDVFPVEVRSDDSYCVVSVLTRVLAGYSRVCQRSRISPKVLQRLRSRTIATLCEVSARLSDLMPRV